MECVEAIHPVIAASGQVYGKSDLYEREQIGVDDVGVRRDHPVRQVSVCLQRTVLEELG